MRILIDLTSLADNFSGIERFALSVTQEMIRQKEHTFLLVFKHAVHKDFLDAPENVVKHVISGGSKLIAAQIKLPLRLWRLRADCYFFPAFPAPLLFFSRQAVTTIHDLGCWDCPAADKPWMNWYFRILYTKAALFKKKIVTVSEFSKGRIMDILKVKSENICVAYNGLSDLFQDTKYEESGNAQVIQKYSLPERYILCLSTIEPRKNMRLLIDAFAQLMEEGKLQTQLVLAGRKGWLVDNILDGLPEKVLNHIHFSGFVSNEDLPYVYGNASYFVFPSIYEGFGIPPLEAMSQGRLVISSDAASMPEVLGKAAIYFRNNDVEDLKRCMLAVESMTVQEQAAAGEAGRKQAAGYRWEYSAEKLLSFFIANDESPANRLHNRKEE